MKSTLCLLVSMLGCVLISSSQEWEEVTQPPQFLSHHSFGFSIDGMGYLMTGSSGNSQQPTDFFYQYDPSTDTWTELDDFENPRSFGIGDTFDGKAYFGFGTDPFSYKNDLWVYDPQEDSWESLSNCPCTARIHPALVANNGKIYMGLGGSSNQNLGDWWEYDIATDTWEEKASFPGANRHHPFQFSIGQYVYVGLGHGSDIYDDLYRYDPDLDTWTEVASLPGEARVAGTQFSHDGLGYILSGEGDDHGPMVTGEFWYYNPEFDSWEELTSHPGSSRWAPASFVIDNEVYLINGMVRNFFLDSFIYQEEMYKFSLENFTSVNETNSSMDPEVKVYPNPTTTSITVTGLNKIDSQISITNSLGQDVLEWTSQDVQNDNLVIDFSELSAGVYYLKIGSAIKKIQRL